MWRFESDYTKISWKEQSGTFSSLLPQSSVSVFVESIFTSKLFFNVCHICKRLESCYHVTLLIEKPSKLNTKPWALPCFKCSQNQNDSRGIWIQLTQEEMLSVWYSGFWNCSFIHVITVYFTQNDTTFLPHFSSTLIFWGEIIACRRIQPPLLPFQNRTSREKFLSMSSFSRLKQNNTHLVRVL